jgi:hypothetical protein
VEVLTSPAEVLSAPLRRVRSALGRRLHDELARRDLEIPERTIDQLTRYEPVLRLVRELGGGSVLDVGSSEEGIAGWLYEPGWSITICDKVFWEEAIARSRAVEGVRRVVGDARDLPFADRDFDVTVALDLLEHIPAEDRGKVLDELARVTRRRLIVGCPCGADALAADCGLARSYSQRGQDPPAWLREHLETGFPDVGELRSGLERFGRLRLMGSESIAAHERVVRLLTHPNGFYASRLGASLLAPSLRRRNVTYPLVAWFLWLVRGRDRPPTYRTVAVLSREPGAPLSPR